MSDEVETPDHVWRLVWSHAHLRHKTDWTIHFDKVRSLYDDYSKDMPGADIRMQQARITDVGEPEVMEFGGGGDE